MQPGKKTFRAYLTWADGEKTKSLQYETERGVRAWIARQEQRWGKAYRVRVVTSVVLDVETRYAHRGRPRTDI